MDLRTVKFEFYVKVELVGAICIRVFKFRNERSRNFAFDEISKIRGGRGNSFWIGDRVDSKILALCIPIGEFRGSANRKSNWSIKSLRSHRFSSISS